ncbi:hypothetical protein [Stenotrophomonas mori]|uniref:TonB-dependent receptor n=1 Tax=Stenotrophomonas mori TaxID=2871096 RepID=A0ABT0SIM6_9GAMM|nr:hypothetical protein [Stenotrophomonas mori]MCL7714966.1 hypothetical protein [Stenotrophomonas mori]
MSPTRSVRACPHTRAFHRTPFATLALSFLAAGPALAEEAADATDIAAVHVTAQQIARQALGISTITAEGIEKRTPANENKPGRAYWASMNVGF